jgi:hypothetical protein
LRHQRTLGLDSEQLEELHARVEDILAEPWDKGTDRPKKLTLREAIVVTLIYKRQNITEEVIGDIFGVSQRVVSNVITMLTPPITDATEEFRPDTEEARQVTRGRLALVDGTLWPCWSWEPARNYGRGNTERPAMAGPLSAMNTATPYS